MTPTPPAEDDFLDGMCDADFTVEAPTADEDAPYVALFADLIGPDGNPTDDDAVANRAREWAQLEGGAPDGP